MDLMDVFALWGRKYERQSVPGFGRRAFSLGEVLEAFDRVAVLELSRTVGNRPRVTVRPDPIKKVKVSLLDDGISSIHSGPGDRYEVYRTAPSGDLSKAKIIALSADGTKLGEIKLLTGRRTPDHYFRGDPLLDAIAPRRFSTWPSQVFKTKPERNGFDGKRNDLE
jgi:hypothetical protein